MTVTKVYVTRTVRCKDGGSWSFQVEAGIERDYIRDKNGVITSIESEHDYLKDLEELEDKLHHWLHTPEMQEKLTHSKTEG